jgi:DNA helicase-2/ATP-dependent DNA helicase PcrA
MMIPTRQQHTILHAGRTTSQSLLIEALAGTGKTTTLIELIKVMREASIAVLAFNKRIADVMTARMPPMPRTRLVHVKTLHSAGNWITQSRFPGLKIDRDVTEQRIRDAAGNVPFRLLGAATRLLRVVKDTQCSRDLDPDIAYSLGHEFDCFNKLIGPQEPWQVAEIVRRAYKASQEVGKAIDFPDQGWLPLVLDLEPPWRYKAILLDEAQDVNENQMLMVEKLLAPGGRIIACGDLNQEIYSWRGAVGRTVWNRLKEKHKAQALPLTTTWRCDQAIVREANTLVPTLRARDGAGPGVVRGLSEPEFFADIEREEQEPTDGDGSVFVLSRNNAELLRVALELWRRKLAFNVTQSGDVLGPITAVLQKLARSSGNIEKPAPTATLTAEDIEEALSLFHARQQRGDARGIAARASNSPVVTSGIAAFKQRLGAWYMTEMMKAQAAGSQSWADRVEDQHLMIQYALNYVQDPREIGSLLESIFTTDDTCFITLSTVHKAKGLEADHVYLLRETFARYQRRVDREGNPLPIPDEELNIEYVAITRAKRKLTWVHMEGL